jgi:hypothetical protein
LFPLDIKIIYSYREIDSLHLKMNVSHIAPGVIISPIFALFNRFHNRAQPEALGSFILVVTAFFLTTLLYSQLEFGGWFNAIGAPFYSFSFSLLMWQDFPWEDTTHRPLRETLRRMRILLLLTSLHFVAISTGFIAQSNGLSTALLIVSIVALAILSLVIYSRSSTVVEADRISLMKETDRFTKLARLCGQEEMQRALQDLSDISKRLENLPKPGTNVIGRMPPASVPSAESEQPKSPTIQQGRKSP